MPTKPSHKKHGKDYLDEAVAKSTYRKKPITRSRAIKAGILGILLGTTGIHNAMMRNKKRGFVHLLFSSISSIRAWSCRSLYLPTWRQMRRYEQL